MSVVPSQVSAIVWSERHVIKIYHVTAESVEDALFEGVTSGRNNTGFHRTKWRTQSLTGAPSFPDFMSKENEKEFNQGLILLFEQLLPFRSQSSLLV